MRRRGMNLGDGGDQIFAKTNRTKSDAAIDVTPLIDVVFFLLVFFMITSNFENTRQNDVPPARHGVDVDNDTAIVLTINRPENPDADPVIILSDGKTPGTLDDIKADVEKQVAEGKTRVILKADRDVVNGVTMEVMRRANEVEGVQFYFEVRDKKKK